MITAIQNFISKKGKFVFYLLLIVVIFAFVLYLAQGSSVFDLFPDPNRERRDFYGVDLNDPDENRKLSIYNRPPRFRSFGFSFAGSDAESDARFVNLQAQVQAVFQANREEVDQAALQRLSVMQSWPNLPNSFKVREIVALGLTITSFSIVHTGEDHNGPLRRLWGFLPLNLNHPQLNFHFIQFVENLIHSQQRGKPNSSLCFRGSEKWSPGSPIGKHPLLALPGTRD